MFSVQNNVKDFNLALYQKQIQRRKKAHLVLGTRIKTNSHDLRETETLFFLGVDKHFWRYANSMGIEKKCT